MIGFTAIWLLLQSSQGPDNAIRPVTALWVIAIPLMDMVAIVYRRLHKGTGLFSPDRQHIHHLLMRAGLTSRQACMLITLAAVLLAAVGIAGEFLAVPEYVMLALFCWRSAVMATASSGRGGWRALSGVFSVIGEAVVIVSKPNSE